MADLVIRGMEMPKEGEKILIAADGSVWVNAWPTRGYMRMENVHAVPLPEGHGRLIDADALRDDWLHNGANEFVYDANTVIYSIDDATAIVPAEGEDE